MGFLIDGLGAVGFAWLVLIVHESGHVLVARLAGVPRGDVRLVTDSWPAHTALRQDSAWLAPDDPGYVEAFNAHRETVGWSAAFVAGGHLLEVPISLLGIVALMQVSPGAAVVLAWTTAALSAAYLLADVILSWKSSAPYGDHVALWRLQPQLGAFLVLALVAGKVLGISLTI